MKRGMNLESEVCVMKAKLYHVRMSEVRHRKQIPADSVLMILSNGMEIVCSDFSKSKLITVSVYHDGNWKTVHTQANKYTEAMLKFYLYNRKHLRGYAGIKCEDLMKHDRVHKGGGSGQRLTPFCGQVTDYETRKEPFHDFRRVWN